MGLKNTDKALQYLFQLIILAALQMGSEIPYKVIGTELLRTKVILLHP